MSIRVIIICAMLVFVGSISGCRTPIDDSRLRTPYDLYAAKRGQARPSEVIGATSGKLQERRLRERLTPLDR